MRFALRIHYDTKTKRKANGLHAHPDPNADDIRHCAGRTFCLKAQSLVGRPRPQTLHLHYEHFDASAHPRLRDGKRPGI